MGRELLIVLACACHARPAPPRAPPIEIGVAWRIRNASLVGTSGPSLAVTIAEELRFVDPRDGYRLPASWHGVPSRVIAARDLVILDDPYKHALVALGRPRATDDRTVDVWKRPFADDEALLALAADATHIYLAIGREDLAHDELAALAIGSGAVAWRRPLPDGWQAVAVSAGVVICRGDRASAPGSADDAWPAPLLAQRFEPSTGVVVWQRDVDRALAAASDGEHVVVARTGVLSTFDARGAVTELAMPAQHIAIADGIAYVAAAGVVSAIRLADRAILWSQAGPRAPAKLAVGDRAVYVLSDGATLHALDRATGEPRWEWSFGAEDIELAAAGERLYVTGHETGTLAFAPGGAVVPPEDAVIHGRIATCAGDATGVIAQIGDREAPTGADGRFEVRVLARGALRVTASRPGDHTAWPWIEIRLVGHGRYDAGVIAPQRCPKT